MENRLNGAVMLSLKEIALRKTVVSLWIENDILAAIEDLQSAGFDTREYIKEWQKCVERRVKNKVKNLVIPKTFKDLLHPLVRPIGSDILRWMKFHEYYLSDSNGDIGRRVLKQLHWNSRGAIDYQETAEGLVNRQTVDSLKRFRLACCYCLVGSIPHLWEQLDEEGQLEFYRRGPFLTKSSPFMQDFQLEYVWPYILKGEESVLDGVAARCVDNGGGFSFNQCVFEASARRGNRAAAEYFYQRLTAEERDSSLTRAVDAVLFGRGQSPWLFAFGREKERPADVLSFLLPMLRAERRMEVLRNSPCHVLSCFLDWPWHDLFLEIAGVVWHSLPVSRYKDFYLTVRNHGFYFPNLVQDLFRSGPREFKTFFLDYESQLCRLDGSCCLVDFFCNKDAETIRLVFRTASAEERMRFVTSRHFFQIFYAFTMNCKWRSIQLCLRETIFSREDEVMLKTCLMKFLETGNVKKSKLGEEKWKWFFKLLDATARNNRRLAKEIVVQAEQKFSKKKRNCICC